MTLRITWSQPICAPCLAERERDGLEFHRDTDDHDFQAVPAERCCVCGRDTYDGIVAKINPVTVKYPRLQEV